MRRCVLAPQRPTTFSHAGRFGVDHRLRAGTEPGQHRRQLVQRVALGRFDPDVDLPWCPGRHPGSERPARGAGRGVLHRARANRFAARRASRRDGRPAPGENEGGKYLRFIPRNEMDIAVVGVGSWIRWDPQSGRITDARIALGAVAPTPVRAPEAEAALIGKEVSWDVIDEASRLAVNAARPISDVRGSAEYRRHLVSVLVRRTLLAALERAGVDVKDLGGEAYAG